MLLKKVLIIKIKRTKNNFVKKIFCHAYIRGTNLNYDFKPLLPRFVVSKYLEIGLYMTS